jgi:uncharacterized damage-inducible protein DinB
MNQEWTAPSVEREDPAYLLDEREALEASLDFHRDTLLWKCSGLNADQLKRRAVPPSRLSLLGLVRHMTDVEQWWFRMHAGGEDLEQFVYTRDDDEQADFENLDSADAEADLRVYRQEVEAARAAVRNKDLADVVSSRGHRRDVQMNVRWIYLHMIEEYARHNGHADLIREVLDGSTGD